MITATIKRAGFSEAVARLRGLRDLLMPTVTVAAKSIVADMAGHATKDRMTHANPPYLNRRTGTGVRSVMASQRVRQSASTVVGSFGTNLGYIIKHEQGFEGTVTVPAHTRRRSKSQKAAFRRDTRRAGFTASEIKMALSMSPIDVRSYSKKERIRARRFLQDTLEARTPEAGRRYRRAVFLLAKDGRVPDINRLPSGGGA